MTIALQLCGHSSGCVFLQDLAGGMVVTDIQIITDKEAIPHGYCYIPEHLDSSKHTHIHVFLGA